MTPRAAPSLAGRAARSVAAVPTGAGLGTPPVARLV